MGSISVSRVTGNANAPHNVPYEVTTRPGSATIAPKPAYNRGAKPPDLHRIRFRGADEDEQTNRKGRERGRAGAGQEPVAGDAPRRERRQLSGLVHALCRVGSRRQLREHVEGEESRP